MNHYHLGSICSARGIPEASLEKERELPSQSAVVWSPVPELCYSSVDPGENKDSSLSLRRRAWIQTLSV